MVMIDMLGPNEAPTREGGSALWATGFRPFFLVAGLYAALMVPWWALVYARDLEVASAFSRLSWHGHEMVFGFAMAVIAGFLLTAVQNWTRMVSARGPALMGLVGVWLAGRLAMSGLWEPGVVGAVLDLLFVPALALVLARPLWKSRNRRNMKFVVVLGGLFVLNLLMHLAALGLIGTGERVWLMAALDLVVVMMLVVGGRVIPMFTRNATGAQVVKREWIEKVVVVFVGLSMVTQLALLLVASGGWMRALAGGSAAVAGVAVLARMCGWATGATRKEPLLWVLHAGHAWIGIGFLLRAAALQWPGVSSAMATHAITVGAVGMLTLGMMARVALGHTGRPLKTWPAVGWAFGLVGLAALLRTFAPMLLPVMLPGVWPGYYTGFVAVAAGLWGVAFAVYSVVYLPVLVGSRVDGRPG
ncbi:hypothetical protein DL240_00720 [Lujinxingia litoralis]|uniref:NnrS family protein n=1 Tax=Lujinxingia litoralis TaxID=2211119 RepID=A0A328C8K6_9DELT|nr:NnrS family protein [Lujinxingia litoralis]RAL24765.1 hypothetical protein DL240_00720 [Lujinxingia litoralis]